jgi:hypothetical protein
VANRVYAVVPGPRRVGVVGFVIGAYIRAAGNFAGGGKIDR